MAKPTNWTEAVGDAIIEQLTAGVPLAEICRQEGMPAVRTVADWRKAHQPFADAFALAREAGFDAIAVDALRIADTPISGAVEEYESLEVPDPEAGEGKTKRVLRLVKRRREDMLGHRKLQVETRLKLLAKWDPSRYGEKLQTEHSGEVVVHRKVFRADDDGTDPAHA